MAEGGVPIGELAATPGEISTLGWKDDVPVDETVKSTANNVVLTSKEKESELKGIENVDSSQKKLSYANVLEKQMSSLENEVFDEDFQGKFEIQIQVNCSNLSRSPEGQRKVIICIVAKQLCFENVTFEKIDFKGGKNASIVFLDRVVANDFILKSDHGPIKVIAVSGYQERRIGLIHDFPCDLSHLDILLDSTKCDCKIIDVERVQEKKPRVNADNKKRSGIRSTLRLLKLFLKEK